MPVDQTPWRVAKAGSQWREGYYSDPAGPDDDLSTLEHEFPRLKGGDFILVRPMHMRQSEWREGTVTGTIRWSMRRGGTIQVGCICMMRQYK